MQKFMSMASAMVIILVISMGGCQYSQSASDKTQVTYSAPSKSNPPHVQGHPFVVEGDLTSFAFVEFTTPSGAWCIYSTQLNVFHCK